MRSVEWIPIGAWLAALVVAVVVFGYCAYELAWKTRRLRRDLAQLQTLNGQLGELYTSLADVQRRR